MVLGLTGFGVKSNGKAVKMKLNINFKKEPRWGPICSSRWFLEKG